MKLKLIVCAMFFLFATNCLAATPITHVYFAHKWIASYEQFNEEEEGAFMRGTLFPDIRHLGALKRAETHEQDLALKDIINADSSFAKGKKLHCFIDEIREAYVDKINICSQLQNVPGQKYIYSFLKFLEDEVLYNEVNHIKIKNALKVVDKEEMQYRVEINSLMQWHHVLDESFSMSPSAGLAYRIKNNEFLFGLPVEIAEEWSKILPIYAKKPEILVYVHNLIKYFNDVLEIDSKVSDLAPYHQEL